MARIRVTPAISRKIRTILYENCGPPEHYEVVAAQKGIHAPNTRTLIRWIEGRTKYINESSLVPFAQTLGISYHELIADLEMVAEVERRTKGETSKEEGNTECTEQVSGTLIPDPIVEKQTPSTPQVKRVNNKFWWFAAAASLVIGVAIVGMSFLSKTEPLPAISLLNPTDRDVDPDSAFLSLSYPSEAEEIQVRCQIGEKYEWEMNLPPVSMQRLPLIGEAEYQCSIQVEASTLKETSKTSSAIHFRTQDVERPNLYIPGSIYPKDVSWYQAQVAYQKAALTDPELFNSKNKFYFDGQYAWVDDRALYDFNESSFTVHFAFNAAETKEAHLISKAPANANRDSSWAIILDDRPEFREEHKVRVCFINPHPKVNTLCASELLDTKRWHSVAFSYNYEENSYIWYIDGKQVDQGIERLRISNTNTSVFLGMQQDNPHHTLFKGELKDIRIYKSVVSPDRIRLWHNVIQETI